MTIKELIKMIDRDVARRIALLKKKGSDYSNEDTLSNFKRIGSVIETLRVSELEGKYSYALFLILLKMDRIINLMIKKTSPANESLDDTFMDLKNYVDLLHALYREKIG